MHTVYADALAEPSHYLEILPILRLKPGSSTVLGVDTLCGPKEELADAFLRVVTQLEEEDDGCSYYLIDHNTQTEFWLLDYSSEELNMPASLSLSQLSE